jgi:hypothetical protein
MSEFTYSSDEFEIDGVCLSLDVDVTLYIDRVSLKLEQVEWNNYRRSPIPFWLNDALSLWVVTNRDKLARERDETSSQRIDDEREQRGLDSHNARTGDTL